MFPEAIPDSPGESTRSQLVSRLECTPLVIISCLAGQTTARACLPCLKKPNCPPLVFARQTPSQRLLSLSRINSFPSCSVFSRGHVPQSWVARRSRVRRSFVSHRGTLFISLARPCDNCRHAILFFVCPHNSTSFSDLASNLPRLPVFPACRVVEILAC